MATNVDNHGSGGIPAWRIALWGGAAALLSLPAIAMFFDADGVLWTGSDFLAMGLLLAIVCGVVELGMRLSQDLWYRLGFVVAAGAGFLTVWVNLAVGMIGELMNPANLVFVGVLAVAVTGSVAGGFRARGMATTMLATAVAQLLGAGVALAVGTPLEAMLISGFALPWALAAALFRRAARDAAGH